MTLCGVKNTFNGVSGEYFQCLSEMPKKRENILSAWGSVLSELLFIDHHLHSTTFYFVYIIIINFILSLLLLFHVRPFVANLAAKFLYFFKACYFIVSSFQIISGYPVRVISNFLTIKYNTVACKNTLGGVATRKIVFFELF